MTHEIMYAGFNFAEPHTWELIVKIGRGTARVEPEEVSDFAQRRSVEELEQIIKMVKSDMVNVKKDHKELAESIIADLEKELVDKKND